MLVVEGVLIRI